ncbi:hypothetical protein [Actinocrinis sp.]|uniref:hypothetical protein n=1 Tax=Actinocrinis sp. TaxID=1920516 RepID=UPI002D6B59DF|nr:hypothetical protein [Actinocrinis sp.]HZP51329.1 hypothetical protein [Actinocrinis sp.]
MSAAWVAATVRAKALLDRRVGPGAAARLAAQPSLTAALEELADTSYRRFLSPDASPADAERAVNKGVVWNLRVLGGWVPGSGVGVLRVLVADLEIGNLADRLRGIAGAEVPAPYRLGALATCWDRAAAATSAAALRAVLAASAWGDPGTDDPSGLTEYLRLSAASRLAAIHPDSRSWGAAAAALTIARQRFLLGRPTGAPGAARARPLLGARAVESADWDSFTAALPKVTAGWALAGLDGPQELWRGEQRWWSRVESDAADLARSPRFQLEPVLGCAALLLADAHAVRGALASAHRGGRLARSGDVSR